jgi:phage terminase small subunit
LEAEVTDLNGPETGIKTPRGFGSAGRKLWDAAVAEFEWAQHELAMLEEACRTRDRIVQLDAKVSDDGMMIESSQGMRIHPGVAEARQQRLTLARLLATLGIPPLTGDSLPAARGVRGVYSNRGS